MPNYQRESWLKNLKLEFRELCSQYLYLKQIDEYFVNAGFKPKNVQTETSGTRRSRVEEYYASIDWKNIVEVEKFINIFIMESNIILRMK